MTFINEINDILWTYILIIMLLGCAVWFSIRTRFVQFRMIREMIVLLSESAGKGKQGEKHVSSFQAFAISIASRVGTGNLAGVATAIAIVLVKAFNNGSDAGNGAASAKLNYTNAAFIYKIGPFTVNIFLFIGIILLICSYVFLFKTKWGLRLRACGEHPQAADSVGINVYQWRYTGVIISGALGGIGGFAYIVPSVTTWNFEVGVAGAGFLALAVMIFGQWKPFHIAGAAVFFAVFRSLANIADSTVLSHLGLSKNIYNMMPFIASMIILAFTSKNSQAPKAEGIPYDKGAR
jgi:ABC-type uncharacterized transport system permease subunit